MLGQRRGLPFLGTASSRSFPDSECRGFGACVDFGGRGGEHSFIQSAPWRRDGHAGAGTGQKTSPLQLQDGMAEVGEAVGVFSPEAPENTLKEARKRTESPDRTY